MLSLLPSAKCPAVNRTKTNKNKTKQIQNMTDGYEFNSGEEGEV
jgi:hypothetical protein